ncbi:Fe2+-dependent dioxygenase [Tepidiphilus sp. HLB4]|jgi:PKHD-type hydroxylase
MLLTIDEVLSAAEVERARTLLAQARWVDGRSSAGPLAREVKNNLQIAEDCPTLAPLRQLVLQALEREPLVFSAVLPRDIFPPQFNRYRAIGEGEHYGPHVDAAIRLVGERKLRTDVSATLFFSAPEEYDGGELVIHDLFGTQRVKGKAGSIVIYPASSLHEVTPVTRGERLASFMWFQSLVPDPVERRLLFELDMATLTLRSEHGEGALAARFSTIYHNLLRRWSV